MTNAPIQILQFGTGNFLRAFIGSMVQDLNESGNPLNICIIQSTSGSSLEGLEAQNYEYNILTAGFKAGQQIETIRKITQVKAGLKLPDDHQRFFEFASSSEVKWIISNVTEAGMVMKKEGSFEKFAESFAGRLTQWLHVRFNNLPDADTIILPCELLPNNGDLLKSFVLEHAKNWNLPSGFSAWIEQKAKFFNSLVDRIVPGFPSHLDLAIKDRDPFLVQAEPYALWAIQGKSSDQEFLPFLKSKSEVILADDITGYALRKVRILNACHTAMTGHGLLREIKTVGEWISDSEREKFLLEMIKQEIIPTISLDQSELLNYANDVLDRFKNPFVAHKLSDISLNSISKIKSRLLPIFHDYHTLNGKPPEKITLCMISLILFYLRNPDAIRDSNEIKAWFKAKSEEKNEVESLKEAMSFWLELDFSIEFKSALDQSTHLTD